MGQWVMCVHNLFAYRLRTCGSDLAYQIPFSNGIAITEKLFKNCQKCLAEFER